MSVGVYRPVGHAIDPNLRLTAGEWALLFNLDGRRPVAQVAQRLGLEAEACRRAIARLLERGLIAESELSVAEYLAAVGSSAPEEGETTLLALLQRGALGLEEAAPPSLPEPIESAAPPVVSVPPPFRPIHQRPARASARALSLKQLMAFLIGRARSRDQGQLDVYKVFLRVRRDALERNGITTLRFDDDRVVRDPELLEAIAQAVESVLGVSLPAEAFVAPTVAP